MAAIQTRSPKAERHVPGEVGVWVFIMGDMSVFAILFGTYMYTRAEDVALFQRGQDTLTLGFGVANTLLLLTSSLLVVLAVRAIRNQAGALAPRLVAGAMACGLAFCVNKALEYHELISAGHKPATNDFYTYFFVLTGIHLLHLVIGLAVLGFMFVLSRRETLTKTGFGFAEGGGCYWHMVDALWIVLFALFYLVQ